MFSTIRVLSISIIFAFLLLGLLSLVGFPTQRIVDLGSAFNYRMLSLGKQNQTSISVNDDNGAVPVDEAPKLMLPKQFYAVAQSELEIYFDNLVLSHDSEQYRFSVTANRREKVEFHRRKLTLYPTRQGEVDLDFAISDLAHKKLDQNKSVMRIAPTNSGEGEKIRLLIVGDSITRQGWWPNQLSRLLDVPGNPQWSMIGREYKDGGAPFSESSLPGVKHEGEFGWAYSLFSAFNDPSFAKAYHRPKSPFVFGESPTTSKLDVRKYYSEQEDDTPADFVIILLGINDMWGANPHDEDGLRQRLELTLNNAEKLVNAFVEASPDTNVGIMLPPPFTDSEATFFKSYGTSVARKDARHVQHRLVEAMMARFGDKEGEGIWLLPVYATFDAVDGYPIDNAGHPNQYGQNQIAESAYAWVKWVLAGDD